MLTEACGRKNLSALLERAAPQDFEAGAAAYTKYRQVMTQFSELYSVGLVPTTEAFVALSPNNDYHGNLRSLASVLFAFTNDRPKEKAVTTCFNACRDRAWSYVSGNVSFLDTVKGEKTRAFRHNILYPDSSRDVTVDGHMIAAWQGDDTLTMKKAALILAGSKRNYDAIRKGVQWLARKNDLAPCQMQGVLWFARKRVLGIRYDSQTDMFYGAEDVSRTLVAAEDFPPYGDVLSDWRHWTFMKGKTDD